MGIVNLAINSFIVPWALIVLIVPSSISEFESEGDITPVASAPPIVIKTRGVHLGTIIFLHGHGQDGQEWQNDMKKLREIYMKVVCPNANEFPLTFQHGNEVTSWFDFDGERYANIHDDAKGMDDSVEYIHYLIDKEVQSGIQANKIVLCGYGQGGALALQAGLTYHKKLGGIITFSTLKPMARTLDPKGKPHPNIPILHSYQYESSYVSPETAKKLGTELQKVSNKVDCKNYEPEGQKLISTKAMKDARLFCMQHIKGSTL